MQSIQLQNDSLVEIATFLVRRWSEKDKMIVEISDKVETKTRLKEKFEQTNDCYAINI